MSWLARTLTFLVMVMIPLSNVTSLKESRGRTPMSDRDEHPDVRAKLIVSTILEPPFMMLKQDGVFLTGNDRFEGFLADILKSLSRSVGFMYELRLVRDGQYGSEGENGTWNGMIGEIYKGHADMAVGPIVVTDDRRKVVEFTDPILTFQSCALIRKPRHINRQRRPRTSRARINTLEELYQSDYKYGLIAGSTTQAVFKDSFEHILQGMWSQMVTSWPSAFVHSLQEGKQRAEREHYAFILDSPMADYIAMSKPCSFYTTDDFLNVQYYSFVLRHSRSLRLRQSLNANINEMRLSGELQTLYEKWWKNECDKKRDLGYEELSSTSTVIPWRYVTVTSRYSSNTGVKAGIHIYTVIGYIILLLMKSAL